MAQILVDNWMMKSAEAEEGGPSEDSPKTLMILPSRAHSSMDLRKTLNAKRNQEGNLRDKLNNRIATRLMACMPGLDEGNKSQGIRHYSPKTSREWTHQRNSHHRGSHYMTGSQTRDPMSATSDK
ncbi:hypothetical protein Acr_00g0080280 [Actinidia rufa]|uniref:Uncharacterized protein n=1 Tax=Actinidia rufa TaxID=165716 RepID=A0A7J0DUL3_9ERIC|nr:hypothetical protein Acr_00g0080280 [Actinidia rufa]